MSVWRFVGVVVLLGALVAAAHCGNQQECALNSDCLPGRFCSSNNFCEFQCRGKEDCEGCGVCDLRYGICIKAEPANFASLGVCCAGLTDKGMPMTSEGVCSSADAGVEAATNVGNPGADGGGPADGAGNDAVGGQ